MSVRLSRLAGGLQAVALSAEQRERRRRARFWRRARTEVGVLGVVDLRGNSFLVSTADRAVGRELFLRRGFDSELVDNVTRLLASCGFEPAQVIDVGANVGTVTIDLLSRFPRATGVAFEPDETNFRLLRQNILGNGMEERVDARRAAISDHDGSALLELSTDNFGDHRVRVGEASRGDYGEELRLTRSVPAWRLDTLLAEGRLTLDVPTLAWVDVQGHEAQLLDGAAGLREVPVVLEVWPYGLRRAGGYERLQELLLGWASVVEVRGGTRPVERSRMAAFFEEVEARPVEPFTDLLLLPGGLTGC